jgi:mono/diheme cytochrome c family protein
MKGLSSLVAMAGLAVVASLAPPALADPPVLAAQAHGVFQQHCYACHGENGVSKGGFSYILDREKLVERGLLVPGDLKESLVIQRIMAGEMPPVKQPRLKAAEVAILQQWIEAGAPAWDPPAGKRVFLSEEVIADTILADLKSIPVKQRKFARYFTQAHLVNAGRPDKDLETGRLALGKLLNSLSWHPRVTQPRALGRGIYRIDLRDYKWTASNWERVLRDYPHKTSAGNEPRGGITPTPVETPARLIAKWTGAEFPAIRADWFVANASRPPLYHDLLQLPPTDRALERLLQVDVMQDIQDENVVRAGFNDSGVSKNNRLLERHHAVHGAYWRSYDFADNKGRQSIFEHPLGPTNGETSFKQDGGEMIFHLPNGLCGYMIVDRNGKRIDKAPVEIVSDPGRPDQRVETGISCMSCHARGFLPKTDQVRAHVAKNKKAYSAADADTVLALYPPKAILQKLMDEDNARYGKAVTQLGLTLDAEDPVNLVTRRYEAPLDVAAAAAEMGVGVDYFRKMLADYPKVAKALGTLALKGGTVQRDVFDDIFPALVAFTAQAAGRTPGSILGPPHWPGDNNGFAGKGFVPLYSELARGLTGAPDKGVTHCLALSKDAKLGAAGRNQGELVVFDAKTGISQTFLEGHKSEVTAVAFSPQAMWLASGGADRTVRTWDIAQEKPMHKLVGHTDRVRCLAFSPDGWWLASGSDDRCLRLWNHLRGKEVRSLPGHDGPVLSVAWSPDGKWLVSASQDGTLRRWEASTGKELAVYAGHVGAVQAVAVSPDGKTILSGGSDKTVRLWDVASGKQKQNLTGHVNSVVAVAFSADGKKALSVGSQYRQTDALIRGWDLSSSKEERRWASDFSDSVSCAALAGKLAVTGGPSSVLQKWQLSD